MCKFVRSPILVSKYEYQKSLYQIFSVIKSSNQESTKQSAQVAVSGASITKLLDEKFVEVKVDQGFKQSVKDAVNMIQRFSLSKINIWLQE